MPPAELDYALGEDVLEHVAVADPSSLRDIRARLVEVENQLSYVRRVAQSRVDLARSELAVRSSGQARSDLSDVIRRLPEILSEKVEPSGLARFGEIEIDPDPAYLADIDDVVSPMRMLEIGQLGRSDLRGMVVCLESIEARTSVQRRIVQERIDAVHELIAGLYDSSLG